MNINPHPFQLYVTMVEKHQNIIKDIEKTFKDVHIDVVKNQGYDLGPFIYIINKLNLDDYSYIVQLHTKRELAIGNTGFRGLDGFKWRTALLSFIKTPEIFNRYLEAFDKNPLIGMQADHSVIVHHDFYDEKAQKHMRRYLKDKQYPKHKYAFVAGTMFIAKAPIFKDIQNLHLTLADFPDPKGEHKFQLAHIMERLFGYIVYKNHMVVKNGLISDRDEQYYHYFMYFKMKFINPLIRFFYQKKTTKSGKFIIKICKIPFYRRKK